MSIVARKKAGKMKHDCGSVKRVTRRLSQGLLVALVFLQSCSTPNENASEESRSCYQLVDGKALFLGTAECLGQLREQRFSGYLAYRFEESIFYESLNDALRDRQTRAETWIDLDEKSREVVETPYLSGRRYYKVEFIGTISLKPGLYGHMGQFTSGILVKKMIAIEPVTL